MSQLLDIVRFASIEHEQSLVSLANNKDEMALISYIQGLYDAALIRPEIGHNEMVLVQLLIFTHYHFLFSNLSLMRCHLSEAFASARAAIDAVLIASIIIQDRSKQVEYATGKFPFNGSVNRHLGNLVKDGKPLPHRLIPELLTLHKKLSTFASHADVESFVHRVKINKDPASIVVEYFQFSDNKVQRKIHNLSLLQIYVFILDVFSIFVVDEEKLATPAWTQEVFRIGAYIEAEIAKLKEKLPADL